MPVAHPWPLSRIEQTPSEEPASYPPCRPKPPLVIQILRDALLELDHNSEPYASDITSHELRSSILRAIDELELIRTGSHELQAA